MANGRMRQGAGLVSISSLRGPTPAQPMAAQPYTPATSLAQRHARLARCQKQWSPGAGTEGWTCVGCVVCLWV